MGLPHEDLLLTVGDESAARRLPSGLSRCRPGAVRRVAVEPALGGIVTRAFRPEDLADAEQGVRGSAAPDGVFAEACNSKSRSRPLFVPFRAKTRVVLAPDALSTPSLTGPQGRPTLESAARSGAPAPRS